jgi:hypothetical protein
MKGDGMGQGRRLGALALVAATAGALIGPAAAPAAVERAAALTKFDGRVVSVDRQARRFRLRDLERGVVRIHVRASTRFERVAGIRAITRGMRLDVTARRSGGRWVATKVERPRRKAGRHGGGRDDAPGDDRGGHGADD